MSRLFQSGRLRGRRSEVRAVRGGCARSAVRCHGLVEQRLRLSESDAPGAQDALGCQRHWAEASVV
eukprot:COSAG01_NODE_43364_length_430_cov_1.622356_1_plen_65_part_10